MDRHAAIRETPECRRAVAAIAAAYGDAPLSVSLFGSRARGDAREGSDWDFLVLLPEGWERPPGGLRNDPALRAEEELGDLPGQVVAFRLDRLREGTGWGLFRRVRREGVTLAGADPASFPFPEGMATRGAAATLAFAGRHLAMAEELLAEAAAAGDGTVREARMLVGLECLAAAVARGFDAWACGTDSYGPTAKGLPRGAAGLAAAAGMPPAVASPLVRACSGLRAARRLEDPGRAVQAAAEAREFLGRAARVLSCTEGTAESTEEEQP